MRMCRDKLPVIASVSKRLDIAVASKVPGLPGAAPSEVLDSESRTPPGRRQQFLVVGMSCVRDVLAGRRSAAERLRSSAA